MTRAKQPTAPVCRQCKQEAVRQPPKVWRSVSYPRPNWSHADQTPLCPIPDPNRPNWWGPYAARPVWRPIRPDQSAQPEQSSEEGTAA